jgi:hypothetical protein
VSSTIKATTGFQHNSYPNKNEMMNVFLSTLQSNSKTIEFIQTRLRSASDIYKQGGHVTNMYRDQKFRMHFDNKRVIIDSRGKELKDSTAVTSVKHCENLRFISKLPKLKMYSKYSNTAGGDNGRYNSNEDVVIKSFLKGLLAEPPLFALHRSGLKDYNSILTYLKEYKPDIKMTVGNIA